MEWHEGVVSLAGVASAEPNWSIIVCGDWAPTGGHITSIQHSPDHIYGDLLPLLKQSDLSVVNLESVLVNDGKPIMKDGPPLKAPPDVVNGLKTLPFSVICLANNHIMDYGEKGIRDTLNVLQGQQLTAIGGGISLSDAIKPFKTQIQGMRVSVLNAAEGEEASSQDAAGVAPLNVRYLTEQIRQLRSESDVIVVIAHAGREHLPFPPPYVQEIYRTLIDAGADIVAAHHPHAPQGIERYKQGLIAYSLGNFAFLYGQSYLWSKLGYMLQVHFAGSTLYSASIIPYRILEDRLMLLQGADKTAFLSEIRKFSEILENPQTITGLWEAYADLWITHRFADETVDWAASVLAPKDLVRAVTGSLNTMPGLRGRIVRRSMLWLEHWLSRPISTQNKIDRQRHGAAMLRNRFDTLAHRELYLTALGRIMSNKVGTADPILIALLQQWYNRVEL